MRSKIIDDILKRIPLEVRVKVGIQAEFLYNNGGSFMMPLNEHGDPYPEHVEINEKAYALAQSTVDLALQFIREWKRAGRPEDNKRRYRIMHFGQVYSIGANQVQKWFNHHLENSIKDGDSESVFCYDMNGFGIKEVTGKKYDLQFLDLLTEDAEFIMSYLPLQTRIKCFDKKIEKMILEDIEEWKADGSPEQ